MVIKDFDPKVFEAELQHLCGNMKVSFRLNKKQAVGLHIRETDNAYDIQLNPTHYRSPEKLDKALNECRKVVTQD